MKPAEIANIVAEIQLKQVKIEHIEGDPTLPSNVASALRRASDARCLLVLADDVINPEEADAKVRVA